MDIKHIQYLVEIERVHSISQAAENLYLGQPNLSRILRDVEESVGFPIFERTSKGVHPTPRGAIFLQHAHNILREMDAVTMLGPHNSVGDLLRVCIPHSEAAFRVVADYIRSLAPDTTFDSVVRECHVKRALDYLSEGQAEIAIVRFRGEYEDYFRKEATTLGLSMQVLVHYKDSMVVHESHPLANRAAVTKQETKGYVQIVHSDRYFLPNQQNRGGSIYTVDRQAQLEFLSTLPNTYLWSAPIPADLLERYHLRQIPCTDQPNTYCDALVYHPMHRANALETGLLQKIRTEYPKFFEG